MSVVYLQSATQFDSWCMNITIKSLQFLFSFPYASGVGGCYVWPVLVVLPLSPANRNSGCLHDIISSVVCSTCIYGTWHKKGKLFPLINYFVGSFNCADLSSSSSTFKLICSSMAYNFSACARRVRGVPRKWSCLECVLELFKRSGGEMGAPWRWSYKWVSISLSEPRKSSIS